MMMNSFDPKGKSLLQESLTGLFLRLNGYLQSGYISHSDNWGDNGAEIDRLAVRFPKHNQPERDVLSSPLLKIPASTIDIIIAEVKNDKLSFNKALTDTQRDAQRNWKQILDWIGLFEENEISNLITDLISITLKQGQEIKGTFATLHCVSQFGPVSIRPMLFSFETLKEDNGKIWINGEGILDYLWTCFCPDDRRGACSTRYNFEMWGNEYSQIVSYIKNRHKKGQGIGDLNDMYTELL